MLLPDVTAHRAADAPSGHFNRGEYKGDTMRFDNITGELKKALRNSGGSKQRGTLKQYNTVYEHIGRYAKDTYGTERIDPAKYKDLVQEYLDFRKATVSANTVHHDCAALARALGVKMDYFDIPKRTLPTKGRDKEGRYSEAGSKVVETASAVGIRKAEYKRLTGADIKTEAGKTYVHVIHGKGGKETWQMIEPDKADKVQASFDGKTASDKVFTQEEIGGARHANLHLLRRENAREMYAYYHSLSDEERRPLRQEMYQRFKDAHKEQAWSKYQARLGHTPYYTMRGEGKQLAISTGTPYSWEREAVMMVSVFCLSHFREDVTVTNYLFSGNGR